MDKLNNHKNDYDGGNEHGKGKNCKMEAFKLGPDLRGRQAATGNTERAEWKIQTDRRNKSKFLPGTNPQVSGFWIFLLLIGEANLTCPHFTGEHLSVFLALI